MLFSARHASKGTQGNQPMSNEDLDTLLNAVIPLAQQMLEKYGEFYPLGASMDVQGKAGLVGVMPKSEYPQAQEIIDLLTSELLDDAANQAIRASAICFRGEAKPPGEAEKSDAICVHLEHQSGESVAAYLPYKKQVTGQVSYGELFARPIIPHIFAKGSSEGPLPGTPA